MVASPLQSISKTRTWLHVHLSQSLSPEAFGWLIDQSKRFCQNFSVRTFLPVFSTIPNRVGKQDWQLSDAELQSADAICPGWHPHQWTLDQVARSLLLLSLPQAEAGLLNPLLDKLYSSANISEMIALHQTLPLLPYGDRYEYWALEGFRSNVTAVFNAIALWNPYPAQQFDQATWNQLILKAIFVGTPLHPIWGLDCRANVELLRMLMDYVHERWAAHRNVTPELWRLIAPFINIEIIPDLERALETGDLLQKQAVGLACVESAQMELLAPYPEIKASITSGRLSWEVIYKAISC
jgi:hypothetical protein